MKDFAISFLAGIFVLFILWRLKRFGVLTHLESIYLSWERRLPAFFLLIAPILIPGLMLLVWGTLGAYALITNNDKFGYVFTGWTLVVWFVGPLFERERPMYRVLNKLYQKVVSPKNT